jgi:hypothetical protein
VWGSDLRAYANTLEAVEYAALSPNPSFRVGPECLDCSARHTCELLQQASTAAIQYAGRSVEILTEPAALSLEKRLLESAAATIKARLTGIDAQIEAMIRAGQPVPGWTLEPGQGGRQRWNVPPAEVFTLGDMLGIDLRAPAEPITPKQAVKKGIDETVINGYSERTPGSLKLVPVTESTVKAVFNRKE